QQDRLPDAGGCGVEEAAGLADLLAAGLRAAVHGVVGGDDQLLRALLDERVGDVHAERVVAALVRGELLAVDEDRAFPVDGSEMEQETLAGPAFRDAERAAIPDVAVRLLDAGQRALDGEGHEDAPGEVEADGRLRAGARAGELPEAVEVEPVGAGELWAGVFGVGLVGPDVLRPFCQERAL